MWAAPLDIPHKSNTNQLTSGSWLVLAEKTSLPFSLPFMLVPITYQPKTELLLYVSLIIPVC